MRRPPAAGRWGAVAACTLGLAAVVATSPASAQDAPISGFSEAGAQRQRAYESSYTSAISPERRAEIVEVGPLAS